MPYYTSIQEFLVANGFAYTDEDETFRRNEECIHAEDLTGKPLSYFAARYTVPVPREEILVPLPLPLVARFPERQRVMHF